VQSPRPGRGAGLHGTTPSGTSAYFSGARAFPSCVRSILTEICLCHACSCHEVSRMENARGQWTWARCTSSPCPRRSPRGRRWSGSSLTSRRPPSPLAGRRCHGTLHLLHGTREIVLLARVSIESLTRMLRILTRIMGTSHYPIYNPKAAEPHNARCSAQAYESIGERSRSPRSTDTNTHARCPTDKTAPCPQRVSSQTLTR
jgi:hypothetical protein